MKIAAFLPNWVGDVVMATPALRALRHTFPDARILGIARPYVAGVLEGSPLLDEQVLLSKRGAWRHRGPAIAWQLRREKIDAAILFPNTFRAALVARLAGCRRRIGYRLYGRGFLLSDRLEPLRDERGWLKPAPAIDAFNRLVAVLGCPNPGYRMELATTAADEKAADQVWETSRLAAKNEVVCLNPGAAFGSAKYWDKERFVQVAREFVDRRGCGVLVLCGPKEQELARDIARDARRSGVHALSELSGSGLSLGLTKACIKRASLLVTTDSGPRHFAAAFDRPVVTLFGPTHIAWTETYHPAAVHLQKKVDCGPCQLRECPLDHQCMKLLTVDDVFAAAVSLLSPERKAS
ncbi:MAG: lipopolysaccharide heptosyltransferase II [Planctomycetes bacterium]|nr:lipopolysaccharide heptosyltransferase II [Planctomycetota bacterium]